MDDVHSARGQGSQRVVHPLDMGRRESRLAPCAQTTARCVARLSRDGDTLRAAPPRPRRADVLEETAMCFTQILADGNARRGGVVSRHRCRWRTLAGSISAARITSGARTARRARSARRLLDDVSLVQQPAGSRVGVDRRVTAPGLGASWRPLHRRSAERRPRDESNGMAPGWRPLRRGCAAARRTEGAAWRGASRARRSTTPAEKPQSGREVSTGRRVMADHWTCSPVTDSRNSLFDSGH